ncbi:hypothetical protein QVD17_03711 [Tagetes erecta]|uniref:Uncharacterized protein n=1 Tax=Tagetes erecta TaxID=13708 RepID=A0AAD8PA61_TARER|nr:hypothetical protein QVD17_03711 [Tagetes erecta]
MEQSKKMVNQESFIRQRISKANDQLKKLIKDNYREKELTEVMYQCLTGKGSIGNLTLQDLNDLSGLVDQTLKGICKKIDVFGVTAAGDYSLNMINTGNYEMMIRGLMNTPDKR